MENCKFMVSGSDIEEDKLIAAANYIIEALKSRKKLRNDVQQILVNLASQLSVLSMHEEDQGIKVSEIENEVADVRDTIMSWDDDRSITWDLDSAVASDYLNAADRARKLTEQLESLCLDNNDYVSELLRRARDVLQTAMSRLEEEFKNLLAQNRKQYETDITECVSLRSAEEDFSDDGSIYSPTNEAIESLQRENVGRISVESTIELAHPDVILELQSIAQLMFRSRYDRECSRAYISMQKNALDKCLLVLEIEKLSIEDVLNMEWGTLNSKIKKWTPAVKVFVHVYLTTEKRLCNQIFGELGSASSNCFLEASRNQMFQLLTFGEAVSISPRQPERLFPILDMYEVLAELLPDIDNLYAESACSYVQKEFRSILRGLGESAVATLFDFKNVIASNPSGQPLAGGRVHHITRYVMNYLRNIVDYSKTLSTLLKGSEEEINTSKELPCSNNPMKFHFRSVASILEHNIYEKSILYKDASLQHFFLMNNIHYMTQKVKNSELRLVFGDDWIREHNRNFHTQAMKYERAGWSQILRLLKGDGIQNPGSKSVSKTLLKERLRAFNIAFEDVYRTQTAWLIYDDQLREDIRISTSQKVVQAYSTFVGRHFHHISERHIKYTADDVQNYIMDLFEGTPKSLRNPFRRQ